MRYVVGIESVEQGVYFSTIDVLRPALDTMDLNSDMGYDAVHTGQRVPITANQASMKYIANGEDIQLPAPPHTLAEGLYASNSGTQTLCNCLNAYKVLASSSAVT